MRLALAALVVLAISACGQRPAPPEASYAPEAEAAEAAATIEEQLPGLEAEPAATTIQELFPEAYVAGSGYSGPPSPLPDNGDDGEEMRRRAEDQRQAMDRVVEARDRLRRSVRGLQYDEWSSTMPDIRRRARDLEAAVSDLEATDAEGAGNLRYEVDRMNREVRRLEYENWQDVSPDLDRRTRSLGYEVDSLDSSISSEPNF